MPNDQYGRPLAVGDAVLIKGTVVSLIDDPNYVNCAIELAEPMPPSGAMVKIHVNSRQVEKGEPAATAPKAAPEAKASAGKSK